MSYCQNCNRVVVIGRTPDGKKIPLDPKAVVYRLLDGVPKGKEGDEKHPLVIDRSPFAMAAHEFTCPKLVGAPAPKEERVTYGND